MSTLKTTNITHGSNSGTANMVLASDGKVTIPEKKLYCPGAVVQVQSTTFTGTFGSQSTSYTDCTGLSVAITPTASSSKVFISVVFNASCTENDRWHAYQLVRGSTAIALGAAESSRTVASVFIQQEGEANDVPNRVIQFLDSPGATSATTYKLQGKVQGDSSPYFHINRSDSDPNSTAGGRTASTITVMEIAG